MKNVGPHGCVESATVTLSFVPTPQSCRPCSCDGAAKYKVSRESSKSYSFRPSPQANINELAPRFLGAAIVLNPARIVTQTQAFVVMVGDSAPPFSVGLVRLIGLQFTSWYASRFFLLLVLWRRSFISFPCGLCVVMRVSPWLGAISRRLSVVRLRESEPMQTYKKLGKLKAKEHPVALLGNACLLES